MGSMTEETTETTQMRGKSSRFAMKAQGEPNSTEFDVGDGISNIKQGYSTVALSKEVSFANLQSINYYNEKNTASGPIKLEAVGES